MRILFLILSGVLSGIFAGMGMGGGTFLVPILSVGFGINQIICQSTNVLCFVCISVVCFFIYLKNKLIDIKSFLCVGILAGVISLIASIFTLKIDSEILHLAFAIFLILLGTYMLVKCIIDFAKNKK